nr:immunoglobulin heavy chain junction region [Mus musculus]
CTRGAFAYW